MVRLRDAPERRTGGVELRERWYAISKSRVTIFEDKLVVRPTSASDDGTKDEQNTQDRRQKPPHAGLLLCDSARG